MTEYLFFTVMFGPFGWQHVIDDISIITELNLICFYSVYYPYGFLNRHFSQPPNKQLHAKMANNSPF